MARSVRTKKRNNLSAPQVDAPTAPQQPLEPRRRRTLSGWPMILGWLAMLIFAFHASTHMVGAGDTWVAMTCGRHFINRAKAAKTVLPFYVDTNEPFSANSHKAGPTPEEVKTWPKWAQWLTDKVGLETVKYWHPTGWINQNWLTHVIFYSLIPQSSYADGLSFPSNALVYWKFAIYILTVICVYYTGRLLGAHPALCAVFACFAMFVGRSFFDVRPAGFSNLLVAVFLFILVLATYRNVLYIWLLIPLAVFWCNVHGGYIYMFIMLIPFVTWHLIMILPRRWTVSAYSILAWAGLYTMAYKFLKHQHLSPIPPATDWVFGVLFVLVAASIATAVYKKVKNEAFYAYHIIFSAILFLCLIPRYFPSIPLRIHPQQLQILNIYISGSRWSFIAFFVLLIGLDLVLMFLKNKLVRIKLKGICHIIAAGFVTLLAVVLFNPFHLTNLTHTFVISVSKHAERWRDVNEWHRAFEWTNPVGTSFSFLVLFVLSIGLTLLWLFSHLLKPRFLKAHKNELEAQKKLFKNLSKILGFAAAVLICWVTFISFSLLDLDAASFFFCAVFVAILLLSIYKSVHFIYLIVLLTLLALWSANPKAGYNGRYIYPFVLLPAYVMLHIFASLFSKDIKIKQRNIIFSAATAVVALLLIVIIFNPFNFLFNVGLKFQSHLDNGIISEELRREFEENEAPLSQDVTVSLEEAGSRWLITDKSRKYYVRKEERRLHISASPLWHIERLLHPHRLRRMFRPVYERNVEVTYAHLFTALYFLSIVSIIIWLMVPYLRKLFTQVTDKIDQELPTDTYQLPKIDLTLIVIAALTIYMAIRSRRFIPIAAIAACPIIAMFIDQMIRTISAARNFHEKNRLAVSPMPHDLQLFFISVSAVAVLTFGLWWGLKFKRIYLDPWPTDTKLNSVFMRMTASDAKPFYALKFIKDNKLEGKMFNYWTEGGFIAWGQQPDPNTGRTPLQLFMDGRAQAAYDRRAYELWSTIISGGPIVRNAKMIRGVLTPLTTADYNKIGQWVDERLKKEKVWVVLMPSAAYSEPKKPSYHFVKGLEHNHNWPLVFYNNKQKIFVDARTPRGGELFNGIANGKTLYPDDFSRNLTLAHNLFLFAGNDKTKRKQALDFAVKAFELNPSQAPIMEIIYVARRFPDLRPHIKVFCKNYFDEFTENKDTWVKEDGYFHRIVAALNAGSYLRSIAQRQNNTKLVQSYNAKMKEYKGEQNQLLKRKRW